MTVDGTVSDGHFSGKSVCERMCTTDRQRRAEAT